MNCMPRHQLLYSWPMNCMPQHQQILLGQCEFAVPCMDYIQQAGESGNLRPAKASMQAVTTIMFNLCLTAQAYCSCTSSLHIINMAVLVSHDHSTNKLSLS